MLYNYIILNCSFIMDWNDLCPPLILYVCEVCDQVWKCPTQSRK